MYTYSHVPKVRFVAITNVTLLMQSFRLIFCFRV